ncbi:toxin [Candidatus Collierbacteria bacterium]|nr:toxin [Candidatus Collierbacteria bacterium]
MPHFDWNEEKNSYLKETRKIGFEDVVTAFRENKLVDVVDHPNQKKYKGQKIMFLLINDYVYAVPYIEDSNKLFLKTIYPSRTATQKYLRK